MTRDEFKAVCQAANIPTAYAGRDWNDAEVRGEYFCGIITADEDMAIIQPLLDDGSIKLAVAKRTDGQDWYQFGHGHITFTDIAEARELLRNLYTDTLSGYGDISYHSASDIDAAEKAKADNPQQDTETDEDYRDRLEEVMGTVPTPEYVTTPGYWDWQSEKLVFSDNHETLWDYQDDNTSVNIIAVLVEDEE